MSALAAWAIREQSQHLEQINGLLAELREKKGRVRDEPAMQILTAVQASLFSVRTHAGQILAHFEKAATAGEEPTTTSPVIDRKRAAAADFDS